MEKEKNQMALYKEEQKKKHQAHLKNINLQKRIISLLKDNSNNPPNIIQHFARKYVLRTTINDLHGVPGLYTKRFPISEFNSFDHTTQEQIEASLNKEKQDNYNRIVSEVTEGVNDEAVKKALIESLSMNGGILDNNNNNPIKDTMFWIQIDLQIYGPHPELPFFLEEANMTIYFTKLQQKELKYIWDNINPNISRGIRYKQMLDCSRSLVELYNLKK